MSSRYTGRIVKMGQDGAPPPDEASAPPTPEQMRAAAEREAEAIVAQARDQAAALIEAAKTEAHEEGRKLAAAEVFKLSAQFRRDIAGFEGDLAGLLVKSIERLLATTPSHEQVTGIVRAVIRDFADQRALVLNVAPADAAAAQAAIDACQKGRTQPIRALKLDEDLPDGQCFLSDGRGHIRIDLKTQLAALREAFHIEESDAAETGAAAGGS